MNYVIYWDIFRDYLVDERVPQIPWARTFQRDPILAVRALQRLGELGPTPSTALAASLGLKEKPVFNLISDLLSLQLIEPDGEGLYKPASHLPDLKPYTIAKQVQGQLARHIVTRELFQRWERGLLVDIKGWYRFFAEVQPGTSMFSENTIHQYASNFRRWLVFAGLLEMDGRWLLRPVGHGAQMGILSLQKTATGVFLGTASPLAFERLVGIAKQNGGALTRGMVAAKALRNAATDAVALGIFASSRDGRVCLVSPELTEEQIVEMARAKVLEQPTVQAAERAHADREMKQDMTAVGRRVEEEVGASWKPSSAKRYGSGLIRYLEWATTGPKPARVRQSLR